MYCNQCGKKIEDNSVFCSSCGNQISINQTNEPTFSNNQNLMKLEKKKATQKKFSNLALFFSCIAALLPVGLIFDIPSLALLAMLALSPAVIISCITFVSALIKRKKKLDFPKKDFIKRITAFCLGVILPALTFIASYITADQRFYNNAMEAYDSKNYEEAYEFFSNAGNYKNSAEMAKESKYQNAIVLASNREWKKAREIFTEFAKEDYKASKELYLYCDVWIQSEIRITMAENKLIACLKDPSSYQNLGNTFSYVITDKGSDKLDLALTIEVKYSATNSFGGRITDTYISTANVILTDNYGINAKKLTEIMNNNSVGVIASKYEK